MQRDSGGWPVTPSTWPQRADKTQYFHNLSHDSIIWWTLDNNWRRLHVTVLTRYLTVPCPSCDGRGAPALGPRGHHGRVRLWRARQPAAGAAEHHPGPRPHHAPRALRGARQVPRQDRQTRQELQETVRLNIFCKHISTENIFSILLFNFLKIFLLLPLDIFHNIQIFYLFPGPGSTGGECGTDAEWCSSREHPPELGPSPGHSPPSWCQDDGVGWLVPATSQCDTCLLPEYQ